jgi:hypothetical protein
MISPNLMLTDCAKEAVTNKERIANDFIARWV